MLSPCSAEVYSNLHSSIGEPLDGCGTASEMAQVSAGVSTSEGDSASSEPLSPTRRGIHRSSATRIERAEGKLAAASTATPRITSSSATSPSLGTHAHAQRTHAARESDPTRSASATTGSSALAPPIPCASEQWRAQQTSSAKSEGSSSARSSSSSLDSSAALSSSSTLGSGCASADAMSSHNTPSRAALASPGLRWAPDAGFQAASPSTHAHHGTRANGPSPRAMRAKRRSIAPVGNIAPKAVPNCARLSPPASPLAKARRRSTSSSSSKRPACAGCDRAAAAFAGAPLGLLPIGVRLASAAEANQLTECAMFSRAHPGG
mmetsp:Transcript_5001/g.12952  ORF Transcript_5001/g.12952 Transcript_5001/m.12952 type:complete len:321 (-) Transcript_5001:57-1019(-)